MPSDAVGGMKFALGKSLQGLIFKMATFVPVISAAKLKYVMPYCAKFLLVGRTLFALPLP